MNRKYMDACLNPVRQRILQVLLEKKEASPAQLLEILSDIPRASMYRHIKILQDAGIIEIAKEIPKRGTLEKYYTIAAPNPAMQSNRDVNQAVQTALMALSGDFSRYLADEKNDPKKDMLTVAQATLMLSDEEFAEFLTEYSKLLARYISKTAGENRKERRITFLSAPPAGMENFLASD